MMPFDPYPEEFIRLQEEERRAQVLRARHFVYFAHSKRGLLARYLHELADRIDPTGLARREAR